MKIAVISGSTRRGRMTPNIAHFITKALKNHDLITEVILLDIAKYDFPVMKERLQYLENPPEGMKEFSQYLIESDGIIIVSPEYNGSFPGSLKNTLDYFYKEYGKKPIGIVTVSAGKFSGVNMSHDLLKLILKVRAFPLPTTLMIGEVNKAVDELGNVIDERFIKSSKRFILDFIWFTEAIMRQKNKPLN